MRPVFIGIPLIAIMLVLMGYFPYSLKVGSSNEANRSSNLLMDRLISGEVNRVKLTYEIHGLVVLELEDGSIAAVKGPYENILSVEYSGRGGLILVNVTLNIKGAAYVIHSNTSKPEVVKDFNYLKSVLLSYSVHEASYFHEDLDVGFIPFLVHPSNRTLGFSVYILEKGSTEQVDNELIDVYFTNPLKLILNLPTATMRVPELNRSVKLKGIEPAYLKIAEVAGGVERLELLYFRNSSLPSYVNTILMVERTTGVAYSLELPGAPKSTTLSLAVSPLSMLLNVRSVALFLTLEDINVER